MKTVSQVRKPVAIHRTRVQQLRMEAGLGMRELAKYAGLSPATVSRVEAGNEPDIINALKLARFFESTVEDLFGSLLNGRTR